MAASEGEFRISLNARDTNNKMLNEHSIFDVSWDRTLISGDNYDAYFTSTGQSNATCVVTPKEGYSFKGIYFDNMYSPVTCEIRGDPEGREDGGYTLRFTADPNDAGTGLLTLYVTEKKFTLSIKGDLNVSGKILEDGVAVRGIFIGDEAPENTSLIWVTTYNKTFYYYNGSQWVSMGKLTS